MLAIKHVRKGSHNIHVKSGVKSALEYISLQCGIFKQYFQTYIFVHPVAWKGR